MEKLVLSPGIILKEEASMTVEKRDERPRVSADIYTDAIAQLMEKVGN